MRLGSSFGLVGALMLVAAAGAQTVTPLVTPRDAGAAALLPASFGAWTAAANEPAAAEPAMSLVNANKAALEEDGPVRSQVTTYVSGGRKLTVGAVQFGDYSGAWSAYTLVRKPGLRDGKELGTADAVGDGVVLFQSGAVLVVAFPATAADVPGLKALDVALPKARGSQAQPPLLPAFLPGKGLEPGSVRYALGAQTYSAEGGVLPAAGLGWEKSAEAITAEYKDRRGTETLTLLLYPTPQIAEAHLKAAQGVFGGLGPKFAQASARREAELVMIASGDWPQDAAATFLKDIHMRQLASNDLATTGQPEFHTEMRKTFSLLTNIMVLFGVLGLAAVLLGLFLGGGRALIRKMMGKPAATEAEFLSLHLAPQNPRPQFEQKP
jgi:hypothetical protein